MQEELSLALKKSIEEENCEKHFVETHSRSEDGRYIVQLPFKPGHPPIGQSRQTAENRLFSLERKFQRNPKLHQLYMKSVHELTDIDETATHAFLPHHEIVKTQGDSAKLRVVYDASCKTSSGLSLIDVLLTGPKLQLNRCDILLQYQSHDVLLYLLAKSDKCIYKFCCNLLIK